MNKLNLLVGNNNTIREYVTINPGTAGGGGETIVGNNCLLMISSHIAHDCNDWKIMLLLANNVPIGGSRTYRRSVLLSLVEILLFNNLLELVKWR